MKNKEKLPELEFFPNSCFTCKYYRVYEKASNCLLLGRTLSVSKNSYDDRARTCKAWNRRPKNWLMYTSENPFWNDKYIPRNAQLKLRKKYK